MSKVLVDSDVLMDQLFTLHAEINDLKAKLSLSTKALKEIEDGTIEPSVFALRQHARAALEKLGGKSK